MKLNDGFLFFYLMLSLGKWYLWSICFCWWNFMFEVCIYKTFVVYA